MNSVMKIPFNKPFLTGKEMQYIKKVCSSGLVASDGYFTNKCNSWLQGHIGCLKAMITNSCTSALEMTAYLAEIDPGDEIIMPSFTFVSTANAFVAYGAVPVFVDIKETTLTIDETKIEQAISSRTKAIVVVHYAGVACDMDFISAIARKHHLLVIEDAAHGILAKYKDQYLGSMGHLGVLSFHESKNITSGEGGALLINDERFLKRAGIISKKGTNRIQFQQGEVAKYTWVQKGSSFLPGEIVTAFLWAQFEKTKWINRQRLMIWDRYHDHFKRFEAKGLLRRPIIPEACKHNGHIYYLLLKDTGVRDRFIAHMGQSGIQCVFHYVPLHQSLAGRRYAKKGGSLKVTENVAGRLVRMPLWLGIENHIDLIIDKSARFLHLLT
jgi:dTDP-4-amino-4,6-dideoxygalactose transaminase